MGQVAEFILYGALVLAGLVLFFVIVGQIIEWPEKGIRWLIARWKARRKPTEPGKPPAPPKWHNGFDDVVYHESSTLSHRSFSTSSRIVREMTPASKNAPA